MIALVALCGAALAFDAGSGWKWQGAPIEQPFDLNLSTFAPLAPAADVEAAFVDSLDTWSIESGANLYLRYGGDTDTTRQGSGADGKNTVIYGGSTFYSSLAVATSTTSSGRMTDCDIRFYRANLYGTIDWHVGEAAAPSSMLDLRHTMVHEIGHCIGLGHSNVSGAIMSATNSSGTGEERRHLQPDDAAGARAIYGGVSPELLFETAFFDTSDPGPAQLTVAVRNVGDGTAWLLEVWLEPGVDGAGFLTELPGQPSFLEAIGAPTPVGQAIASDVGEVTLPVTRGPVCVDQVPQPASVDVVIRDASGAITRLPVLFEAGCLPDDRFDTGDGEPLRGAGGCACASDGVAMGLLPVALAWIGPLALRRRKTKVLV